MINYRPSFQAFADGNFKVKLTLIWQRKYEVLFLGVLTDTHTCLACVTSFTQCVYALSIITVTLLE